VKNELLSKKVLDLYDYVDMRNIILEIFELFKYLDRTNHKIVIPRITRDYKVKYEQKIQVNNSAIENFVLKKLMIETKIENNRKKLFSKIAIALSKLNELELKVFHYAFFEKKNDKEIEELIHHCYKKVFKIKKSACIKFLSCLGLDSKCLKEDERDVSLV